MSKDQLRGCNINMEESVSSGNELTMKRRMIFGYLLYSCGKSFLVYLVIALIATLNYTYYLEANKWHEMWNGIESYLVSHKSYLESNRDYIASQNNFLRAMELYLRQATYNNNSTNVTYEKTRIYAITPTFTRAVQKAELTRLSQTFQLVPNFHWIIVEDSSERTQLVSRLLKESSLTTYTHLATATPPNYKLGKDDPNWKKPRGVEQRNAALRWLRKNVDSSENGVVFFADDDNTYSVKLFQEMRKIQKVGVWPVGLVGGLMVEKPICDNVTNKVVGFNAAWKPNRPFPIDMAGFAINLKLLLENKDALFSYEVESGYQESEILRQIVTKDELEPLADFCTKVYVWHTRTEPPRLSVEQSLIKKGMRSDFGIEV
ncbi:galactosylgalactosylxylosylprotein 3-beta-glucuronosyltransferase I isoform X1 [Polistes fuscatus]|uniref:galactosylgalactosylxylosylprotein 3-beta-glucuronosyltransferase I isoform X1 n=2 Tax=Polistes fuscatus TaxID=30207 RepID=UPI001CA9A2B9|nr:galactosylgalactosylxylosylprotein 3-beta-glucuronosyltransferase I isoform X1 [Polistes fuscatus]